MEKNILDERDMEILANYGLHGLDLSQSALLSFLPDEFISHAGDPIDCIYFVVSGKAKVFLTLSSGKQLLLAYFVSRGIIGDIELMTERPTNYTTIQAVTATQCIALPLEFYAPVLKSNIIFVNYIARELAEKLVQRVINGAITTLQPVETRICAYISQTAINGVFREPLTDAATTVGASYRHLLRSLDKLCSDGILRKEPFGFQILDMEQLNEKAGDLYILT